MGILSFFRLASLQGGSEPMGFGLLLEPPSLGEGRAEGVPGLGLGLSASMRDAHSVARAPRFELEHCPQQYTRTYIGSRFEDLFKDSASKDASSKTSPLENHLPRTHSKDMSSMFLPVLSILGGIGPCVSAGIPDRDPEKK